MIKSKNFWVATIALAIIPLLSIDIAQHYVDWQKEVREELIYAVQDVYSFTKEQKTALLDKVFERNETLTFLFYTKIFCSILLLLLSIYFFRLYKKEKLVNPFKSVAVCVIVIAFFLSGKILSVIMFSTNDKTNFLTLPANEYSFQNLYDQNFKGKVVYVDFWGTTCGPCLAEFRDFTKPLKERYKTNKDINYLYISRGNKYLWKQQIDKYGIDGYHVFLEDEQYDELYKASTKDTNVLMPHYLIIDKQGKVAITSAKHPSDKDSLYAQLDKYLQ
ncbi:TlpA family protein disulfide reductase [Panacibacter ginsenosidivorans]|uniref:TlpA family protein disulfide reductase n=1 Tax=Panacibacter ginsenosidivorans TaxID=1813871 RepID=A0A5B8V9Q0_9BACT|nr:TlpA disulfide reductase family protein [Panacibacter ginsenosidivorans]QEC68154.1 TlpA family protein disulfide reductase [Panacibacter ginsenosidivorans]